MRVELLERANNLNQSGAMSTSTLRQEINPLGNLQATVQQQFQDLANQLKAEIRDGMEVTRYETERNVTKPKSKYRTLDTFHEEEPYQRYTRDSKGALVTSETRGEHVPGINTLAKPTMENGNVREKISKPYGKEMRHKTLTIL